MSRPRTRPTREETRARLLAAAALVFARKGIGDASIEDVCDEAGFSRGAFYSNFTAKDELVLELLDVQMASSSAEIDRLYETSSDPTDFVSNMESDRRERKGPLDIEGGDMLYIELLLHALRNPQNRPRLLEHQRRMRESNRVVLEQIVSEVGRDYPVPLDDIANLIMALDVGLSVNNFIDPDGHRPNQFGEFMILLHQMWLGSTDEPADK